MREPLDLNPVGNRYTGSVVIEEVAVPSGSDLSKMRRLVGVFTPFGSERRHWPADHNVLVTLCD